MLWWDGARGGSRHAASSAGRGPRTPPACIGDRARGKCGSMMNAGVDGIAVISCFLYFAAQPVAAGGPRNANCAYPGKPSGGPCDVGHEQCCQGGPNTTCPMRTYTEPAAIFHLGNTQGCGENDPNGALSLFASPSIFARPRGTPGDLATEAQPAAYAVRQGRFTIRCTACITSSSRTISV